MPSRDGQEELLLRLHHVIRVEPNETAFVGVRRSLVGSENIQRPSVDGRKVLDGELISNIGPWDWNSGWVSVPWKGFHVLPVLHVEIVRDPIDASAIASVVGSRRSPSDPVQIGAVKSNLGSVPFGETHLYFQHSIGR